MELQKSLNRNGVLVVNMVGSIEDRSLTAVMSTLLHSFEYCRAFRDPLDQGSGPTNIAVFCRSVPIGFRNPTEDDFLNSIMRERALSTFSDHEIEISGGEVITDANNKLGEWQINDALEHWRVIRKVLADQVWINY
jgi:hypothetical protein